MSDNKPGSEIEMGVIEEQREELEHSKEEKPTKRVTDKYQKFDPE